MKISYVQMSARCHVDLQWDVDKKIFRLKVASNDLPQIPYSMESTKSLAEYFEKLRTDMKPLTLEEAGKSFDFASLDDVVDKIEILQKRGFLIPKDLVQNIKKEHKQTLEAEKRSWSSRKEAIQSTPTPNKRKSQKP